MPWRNVLDNVLFPMEILRKNDAAARRHALELLDLVGLTAFLSARPHQLSGETPTTVVFTRAHTLPLRVALPV
jgi:NitT/TauT family transport system ATP-binding protein